MLLKHKAQKSMDTPRTLIEFGSAVIEAMAVALIAGTFLWASAHFLVHTGRQPL